MIIDLTELKTKDAELQQSEESYHGLFNTVKDALGILDTAGTFIDVNKGAEEMFCYPREFFIGKTFETLSAPGRNDLAHAFGQVRDAFLGMPQQFEFWGLRNGSEEFLTEVRLYKGTYFGKDAVIFLSVDITERKNVEIALRESEELFRALFNNANDAIFLHEMLPVQKPGRYIMVNNIACTRLGYTRRNSSLCHPTISCPRPMSGNAGNRSDDQEPGSRNVRCNSPEERQDGIPGGDSTHTFELRGRRPVIVHSTGCDGAQTDGERHPVKRRDAPRDHRWFIDTHVRDKPGSRSAVLE